MKVKDLIEELEEQNGELEVVIYDKLAEQERKIHEIIETDGKVFIDVFELG